jgi:hypothetical protein
MLVWIYLLVSQKNKAVTDVKVFSNQKVADFHRFSNPYPVNNDPLPQILSIDIPFEKPLPQEVWACLFLNLTLAQAIVEEVFKTKEEAELFQKLHPGGVSNPQVIIKVPLPLDTF